MSQGAQVVLYEAAESEAGRLCERLASQGLSVERKRLGEAAKPADGPPNVAVIVTGAVPDAAVLGRAAELLARLVEQQVATLVWGVPDNVGWPGGPLAELLDSRTSLDEVAGRLSTLVRYVPLMKRFERELGHVHRLGEQLNRYFAEIDQEMRLAGRLQRDFLPRTLPELPGLDLGLLYRPATWVSGDMYDAFRIDEHHAGLFVADAMGHGVAAGLLTMFLRQALVPKRTRGSAYCIVSPAEALAELHRCLVRQKLPSCQFVTAVYVLVNVRTREVCVARGGHPYPLHISADSGQIVQVRASGGLLGLPDVEPEFAEERLTLAPGDKLVLFTDGLEDDLIVSGDRDLSGPEFTGLLRKWADLSAARFSDAVGGHLDCKAGSLHPADDITLVVVEARRDAGTEGLGNCPRRR